MTAVDVFGRFLVVDDLFACSPAVGASLSDSQQLDDVGEIENLIGTRLIFGQETAAEARRALELLGLDPDDRALVERVRDAQFAGVGS